jgi:orotate phosphoribosyltransferase
MKGIDSIAKRAMELKQSGMNDKEIARELHLSENTIVWLLTKGAKSKSAPADAPLDVKIGWKSVGVFGSRISLMASLLSDMLIEESEKGNFEVKTVVGVAINGIPLATSISEKLDIELAVYRPPNKKVDPGAMSSNYANIAGKDIAVVDDVIGTGETMAKVIDDLRKLGANPRVVLTIVNKTPVREMDGIPIRSAVSARVLESQ